MGHYHIGPLAGVPKIRWGSRALMSVVGIMMNNNLWFHFTLQSFVCRRFLHHGHDPRSPGGLATYFAEGPFDARQKNM